MTRIAADVLDGGPAQVLLVSRVAHLRTPYPGALPRIIHRERSGHAERFRFPFCCMHVKAAAPAASDVRCGMMPDAAGAAALTYLANNPGKMADH